MGSCKFRYCLNLDF